MTQQHEQPWVVAGSAESLAAIAPLIAARRSRQPVCVHTGDAAVEALVREPTRWIPPRSEAVLVLGPANRSPRTFLPGLWLRDAAGGRVPVGWLPAVEAGRLATWARAAVRVVKRAGGVGPLVVLGQWEDRFLRVGLRTSRWFVRHGAELRVFHWTADRISRGDVVAGLAHGPGAAIYFGHGRPTGWAGYHGVRREHFHAGGCEPVGAMLALCCENASRHRTRLSFAEHMVLDGVCGAMLAATTKTRHEDNRLLGPALCEALSSGKPETLGRLVGGAIVPERLAEGGPYRFIGDPAIPLIGAGGSIAALDSVYAPAPDEPLAPWQPAGAA